LNQGKRRTTAKANVTAGFMCAPKRKRKPWKNVTFTSIATVGGKRKHAGARKIAYRAKRAILRTEGFHFSFG